MTFKKKSVKPNKRVLNLEKKPHRKQLNYEERIEVLELEKRNQCKNLWRSWFRKEIEEVQEFVNPIISYHYHKWFTTITLKIKDFSVTVDCLNDSGAGVDCIREGLVPIIYFEENHELYHWNCKWEKYSS